MLLQKTRNTEDSGTEIIDKRLIPTFGIQFSSKLKVRLNFYQLSQCQNLQCSLFPFVAV